MRKFLMSVFVTLGFSASSAYGQIFPSVVGELDLNQYLGKWYEVASTKPVFQRDCVCVTAEYGLTDEGNVSVVNSCRKSSPDGELDIAEGTAAATDNPAKFNVSFGGFSTPFSNYWVVDLAPDYSYAVVSTAFRNPIWVLSRTPELDQSLLDDIYFDLADRGFNVDAISPTLQEGCKN
ncbi:MAG: lipocalin family protein [Oligoflexus sp.]